MRIAVKWYSPYYNVGGTSYFESLADALEHAKFVAFDEMVVFITKE